MTRGRDPEATVLGANSRVVIPRGRRRDRLGPPLREARLSLIGLFTTGIAAVGIVFDSIATGAGVIATGVFLFFVFGLLWGNAAYQLSRFGFHVRRRSPAEPYDERAVFDGRERSLLVLVPSYREEKAVIRQTLVSAALQVYPGVQVTLLIDDPPMPNDSLARRALEDARSLPDGIERWLATPLRRATAAQKGFREAASSRCVDVRRETLLLADELDEAARWLERQIANEPLVTHTDELFVEVVLRGPAVDLRAEAERMRGRTTPAGGSSVEDLRLSYRRLTARFDARLSSFERKRFLNLSHEQNKAMNLNSFLGLLGASWRENERDGSLFLVTDDEQPDFAVEAPPFVLTLDADSLLHPDYAAKLVEFAERPGNDDIAVLQTPYSAVPNAPGIVERTAGATTDIQYLVHQGSGGFSAAYWVGANALIRTKALEDLKATCIERGHETTRFISDRTVIEDTESSLDLVARGWRIHNHPERLSLSATPPDFGSLVIQRRRWANGGLLLIHKLIKGARREFAPIELFLRFHYLLSIALSNIGVLVLLYGGLGAQFSSWWLPVSAAPYFALYARDLRQAGYKRRDVVAVYALNVLLIPANLAGVSKSIEQSVRRRRTPFGRTPKVAGRTAVPRSYHLASLLMISFAFFAATWSAAAGSIAHAMFSVLNGFLLIWAVTVFIGWRELFEDVRAAPTAQ